MRPISIPDAISEFWNLAASPQTCRNVANLYSRNLAFSTPVVSVVIPAYNEEENIIRSLSSLCRNTPGIGVEIIVVNNNSKDNTGSLVRACGVTCIDEPIQGITQARNTGLAHARGKYILNADADTIYPANWITEMTRPLLNDRVALTYGSFCFIPIGKTSRFAYFFYEYAADIVRMINKRFKEEAVNVYGFNSGFRREQGLTVEGFNHPPGTNEDGWLAVKLRDKGYGKLHYVTSAPAWTTDRRIQIDGGIGKAIVKRIRRNV